MDCYPTTINKDFLLRLLAGTSNEVKMLPLKINGSPKFKSTLCLVLLTTNKKGFLHFASKCKEVYSLLSQRFCPVRSFFALDCCSVIFSEKKMLSLEIGLPSLVVAFSQARYSYIRGSCRQEYS